MENSEVMQCDDQREVTPLNELTSEYVAKNLHAFSAILHNVPVSYIHDVYKKTYDLGLCENLQRQLSNLEMLEKLLQTSGYWNTLHKCLNLVLLKEPDFGFFLASQKVAENDRVKQLINHRHYKHDEVLSFIYQATRLGTFLAEHGLYECSRMVYQCLDVADLNGNIHVKFLETTFEVSLRMARASTLDCKFTEANKAIINASVLLTYLQNSDVKMNCSMFYTTCSMYMFSLSQYDKAYNLALQAVQELDSRLTPKVIVDTLRQACKACIIKRLFPQAHVYAKEAVKLSLHWFGSRHPKYADCLSDFGFYLLSVDSVSNSVKYYKHALEIRQELFGDDNIITAITHEDLAYSIYVRDYSQGNFDEAKNHAEKALDVLTTLLPIDHLLLSSSKRVQALILEEVAIDTHDVEMEKQLLNSAEKLHLDSLRLAKQTFGENNVQTAKHYGNLGRLYQSMKRYQDAEKNHLRAIKIKEKLLGCQDYEVALSIGHLASLYNYDMEKYDLAEELYLRSITIGRKLFGVWYSGLEYDYRGLVHLYDQTGNFTKMANYQLQLIDWKDERENVTTRPIETDICHEQDKLSVENVLHNVKQIAEVNKQTFRVGNGS